MAQIFKIFSGLILICLNFFLCISVVSATQKRVLAEDYKSFVVAELENSNFNQTVMDTCIERAKKDGYLLDIQKTIYDNEEDRILAMVTLTYDYKIPLLAIEESRVVVGVAR